MHAAKTGSGTVMVVGARGIPDVEGGAEKNAEMLFPLVAAAGYRVVLLGLEGVLTRDSYRGVELRSVPNRRILKTDKIFYYLNAILMAWKMRPDIVHLQGLGASLFLWAYKLMGARVVVRYGSADYVVSKWGVIGRIGFQLAEYQTRFADAVIAVAPALALRLKGNGIARNVHVIANALDVVPAAAVLPPPGKWEDGIPFVLVVGRVTAQKNIHAIVEGFRLFRDQGGTRYRLLIAGGLDDQSYVDPLRLNLGEDVVLLGRCSRKRLEGLYRRCALFVNGSMHEGCSNAVLEAISRDCPIILSGIAENRDFGLDERLYFDPKDPRSIAGTMSAALADPASYRADRSTFLSWPTVGEKTLAIYRSISN
ncbi:MAG: glycosyltransferase family 4 protein [Sphingomicrobium sp.]